MKKINNNLSHHHLSSLKPADSVSNISSSAVSKQELEEYNEEFCKQPNTIVN